MLSVVRYNSLALVIESRWSLERKRVVHPPGHKPLVYVSETR